MTLRARTVLHGVDQSCEGYANLPGNPNMASRCYDELLLSDWVYDAVAKLWKPNSYFVAEYDFSVDGGSQGNIVLSESLPINTIVLDGLVQVVDAFTSGGSATFALKAEGTGDILAATAIASLGVGLVDIVPDGTATNMIRTTAARAITATIAAADLTAGHLYVFLRCVRAFAND